MSLATPKAKMPVPLYRRIPEKGTVQTLAFAYWEFHYAKRIAETFLVHRSALPCMHFCTGPDHCCSLVPLFKR